MRGCLWAQQIFSRPRPAQPIFPFTDLIAMTRISPFLLRSSPALIALAAAMPLAAQSSPGGFSLPQPTPTPTPAPAGPADERAGVVIPPRNVTPAPRIAPAPVLTDEARSSPSPSSPAPVRPRSLQPAPRPTAAPTRATTTASPAPTPTPTPSPTPLAPDATVPGLPALAEPAAAPAPAASAPAAPALAAPSTALGAPAFDWRWLAAGAALLASLLGAMLLWRRRKPKVLRLAAAPMVLDTDAEPELPRINLALEIPGATRSVMMFTLRYRLTLANRTARAVNDLTVAVQLACARRGESNAASVAAAQNSQPVERIGPHQSRTISGEVQLPLTAIMPLMHGQTPLFIPLLHVTVEGEGQQALTRSFVIGTPGGSGEGRVQPLVMTGPVGALPALKARAIDPPPTV